VLCGAAGQRIDRSLSGFRKSTDGVSLDLDVVTHEVSKVQVSMRCPHCSSATTMVVGGDVTEKL